MVAAVAADCSNNSYCYYYKSANEAEDGVVAVALTYMLLLLAVFEALHYLMMHNKVDTQKYSIVADWRESSCD